MTNSVKVTITDERVLHALELIANAKQSSVRDWINLNLSMYSHRLENAAETYLREPEKWDISLQIQLTPKSDPPKDTRSPVLSVRRTRSKGTEN